MKKSKIVVDTMKHKIDGEWKYIIDEYTRGINIEIMEIDENELTDYLNKMIDIEYSSFSIENEKYDTIIYFSIDNNDLDEFKKHYMDWKKGTMEIDEDKEKTIIDTIENTFYEIISIPYIANILHDKNFKIEKKTFKNEDYEAANANRLIHAIMGMCSHEENIIYIDVDRHKTIKDLIDTISHEIIHIIHIEHTYLHKRLTNVLNEIIYYEYTKKCCELL